DGDYAEKVGNRTVTEVGTPGFSGEGFSGGNAYMGAADSHLEISTEGLTNSEFSATFWYKANPVPNRAGILVIGPEDSDNPDAQNIRTSGFRFFREASGTKQIFKLNAGSGDADSWFDGGAAATIDPASGEWVFMAFTISGIECVCYINGEVAAQGEFPGIDWTGCDILSIGSGAPRFTGWEHYSDLSALDELRLYNKALTLVEVQNVMNSD
ncbi:MAG: LamG domain-containing protein, partial [Prolixibacteraceae bacterium]|nr:LamG domain-containing protein [Prolixibacteraceae bacterium]